MKAVVNTGPNTLEFLDVPTPEPGSGQVRIHTGACAVCATDLKMIAGWQRTGFPAIPGHEWAGTVDAVGENASESLVGLRCVGENVLKDGGEIGFEHPGGYGEYFVTEADKLHALPDSFPLDVAALIEPLAVSVRALRRLGPNFAEPVLIFGDGCIGLILLMLLNRAGVKDVTLIGGRDNRLRIAGELGATGTLNYHGHPEELSSVIRTRAHAQFPTIIEASGSGVAANVCLDLAASCGRILVLGDYSDAQADFRWNHLIHQQIKLIGSCFSSEAWPEAVGLAVREKLPLERVRTHRFPAERFSEAIEIMHSRHIDFIKIVLEWK